MNYFGHAVMACGRYQAPAFVFGSMVPDFAAMLRISMPKPSEPAVADGVAFHHETDTVFHQAPTFVELNHRALEGLRDLGVRRGPARAAAHIGTEMLIDGVLVRNEQWVSGYLDALREVGAHPALLDGMTLEQAEELRGLAALLLERGAAVHRTSQERLDFRLGRTLAGRRLLEPVGDELSTITSFLLGYAPEVEGRIPRLLEELSPLLLGNAGRREPR